MARLRPLKLVSLLFLLSSPVMAARAVMEGIWATNNTVLVDTTNASVITPSIGRTFIGLGRNRILNGAMRIDQNRQGSAYSTAVGGSLSNGGQAFYALDQWRFESTVSSTFTVLQTNESLPPTTANSLFNQAMRIAVISSSTVGAADAANMEYPMDPVYQVDWGWGSSNAVPVTLQFWVLSSSAGVHSVAFLNGVNSRSYVSTYTVTQNVWEKKIITIPGDTAGNPSNWPSSGTVFGLKVVWDMGSGSNVTTATLGQWQAGSVWKASGADNYTNGLANVYFTGIQLEVGPKATSFEYMPYDDELRHLQRYFTVIGGHLSTEILSSGQCFSTSGCDIPIRWPVTMFTTPTVTVNNATNFKVTTANATLVALTAMSASVPSATSCELDTTVAGTPLIAGNATVLYGTNTNATIFANARLGGS